MSNTTIIECRQLDSNNPSQNGEWENILVEPITIYPNDQIGIKSVFIDTIAQTNNKINLVDDLNVSLSFSLYNQNWKIDNKTYSDATKQPDGRTYILTQKTNGASVVGVLLVKQLQFGSRVKDYGFGGIPAQVQYINFSGQKVTLNVPIQVSPDKSGGYPFDFDAVVKLDANGKPIITILNADEIGKENAQGDGPNTIYLGVASTEPVTADLFEPYVATVDLTIPKGTYSPQEICKLINDYFSVDSITGYIVGNNTPSRSQLLKSSRDSNNSNNFYMMYSSIETREVQDYTYNITDYYWFGTNQFELAWDDAQQRFYFNYLHMPYYNNDNICVQFIDSPVNGYFLNSKAGGILLNDMQPSSFWQDLLGFDLSSILVQFKHVVVGTDTVAMPTKPLVNGVNMTSGFNGITSSLLISSTSGTDFDKVPDLATPFFTIIGDSTIGIYGKEPSFAGALKFPYFLIDIDTVFKTDLLGQNRKTDSIQGIVSRYYSIDSYTSGGTETSIPYVHLSPYPIQLTSLNIRILQPDGTVPASLGKDNNVFITIEKSQPIRPIEEPKKK